MSGPRHMLLFSLQAKAEQIQNPIHCAICLPCEKKPDQAVTSGSELSVRNREYFCFIVECL